MKSISKILLLILSSITMMCPINGEAGPKNNPKVSDNRDEKDVTGIHTITYKHFEFDPYSGNYIDEYWFVLDNNFATFWCFPWFLYEKNKISLSEGDSIQIIYSDASDPKYWMIIDSPTPKIIGFQQIPQGNGTTYFYAASIDKDSP